MARCLPFPPPRFVLNGVSGVALLELIKVRREKEVAEKRRKEEKRRRKKKKKEWEEREISKNKSRHKHKKIRKCWDTVDCQMNKEIENQLLDRSNLTEELHRSISDSLYESSDNTENIKEKELCSSINARRKHGSIVRVDLQLEEVKDSRFLSSVPVRPYKQLHSSSRRTDAISDGKAKTASISNFSQSCIYSVESKYRELILNSVPPTVQIENSEFDDDQDWIFERKLLRKNTTDMSNAFHNDLRYGRCSIYPGITPWKHGCFDPNYSTMLSHCQHHVLLGSNVILYLYVDKPRHHPNPQFLCLGNALTFQNLYPLSRASIFILGRRRAALMQRLAARTIPCI